MTKRFVYITIKKTAFVLTIEGANVFNSNESLATIKRRIAEVKNWNVTSGQSVKPLPVFFISFAHHFYNHLCGHAHSIPDAGNLLLSQEEGMNSGFTEKGKAIIRYLLSLSDDNAKNEQEYGKRILIDTKHMSAAARKYYYTDD